MAFVFEQTITDCFTSAGDGNTMTSWSPQADEILLLCVVVRAPTTAVSNVAGNGLTWTQVRDVDNARDVMGVTVFRASSGSTPSTGSITFDHNTSLTVFAMAVRISGGDRSTTDGVEADSGAPGGDPDNNDMLVDITTLTDNALVVGMGGQRGNRNFDPGSDETEEFESSGDCNSGGDRIRGNIWFKTTPVTPIGTHELGQLNSWNTSVAWSCVGLSLKPVAAGVSIAVAMNSYRQRHQSIV